MPLSQRMNFLLQILYSVQEGNDKEASVGTWYLAMVIPPQYDLTLM